MEDDDPLNLKNGGMMDIKAMKNYKQKDDAYDVGTQFSKVQKLLGITKIKP